VKYWLSLLFEPTEQLLDLARMAEEFGLEGVVMPDHVVIKVGDKTPHPSGYPTLPEENFIDPFCAFAAMSAVTTTLRFMNYVYVVPLRDPFVVAKQVSSVAQLSNNRVTLATGTGWLKEEFEAMGQDFSTRGKRLDETLEILRDLWDDGYAEFHGKHYDFPRSGMFPVPTEKIPIIVGGHSVAAARRAARYDGYILMKISLDEGTKQELEEIDTIRREEGLADEPFEKIIVWGGPNESAHAHELADAGITGAIVMPWMLNTGGALSLAEKRTHLEQFVADVASKG
jgi:probable F420-dependent oxidoreductase